MRDRLHLSKAQFKSLWLLKREAEHPVELDSDVAHEGYSSIADGSVAFVWDPKHDDPAFADLIEAENWVLTHINTERHEKL